MQRAPYLMCGSVKVMHGARQATTPVEGVVCCDGVEVGGLGVLGAVEAVRAMNEARVETPFATSSAASSAGTATPTTADPSPNAYLECHTEQGPILAAGVDIGIVTGVQSMTTWP